ncbi:hypothetical protein D9757_004225 [Collybiopsis confluens]|uniref:WSC domain-containing protein n=1 Tax=Collybiopsis confluens TaxID=2823264 RepID=A0A8H5HU24_9AGAR|nr:hypothetical protein D9757_004225 [Collybiopsis confluens]
MRRRFVPILRGVVLSFVYSTSMSTLPAPGSFKSLGCVAEGTTGARRALTGTSYTDSAMTPAICQSLCVGYKYAGTEYGSECYCGDTFTNNGASGIIVASSNCNSKCSGDTKIRKQRPVFRASQFPHQLWALPSTSQLPVALYKIHSNLYCPLPNISLTMVSSKTKSKPLNFPRPTKKALLIGIKSTNQSKLEKLLQPHKDARMIQKLLIEQYQYREENIVTMLDCSRIKDSDRHPTHANILRELHALVADAQPDDHLFFYYAGHVDQKPTDDPREVDGFDEYILPCDSTGVDHNAIQDDLLKEILIENLPARCKLTAVIDACHSGTLLDLEHWRCNRGRLKFPFRPDQVDLKKRYTFPHNSSSPQGLAVYENRRTGNRKYTQCKVTLQQSERTTGRTPTLDASILESIGIKKRSTAPDTQLPPARTSTSTSAKILRKLRKTSTSMSINASAMWKNRFFWVGRGNSNSNEDITINPAISKWKGSIPPRKFFPLEIPRCVSPDRFTRSPSPPPLFQCDEIGCREHDVEQDDGVKPLVMALSACDDAQRTWETESTTMTQMFVNMLERNPHPKLGHMMDILNHKVHGATVALQNDARQYKQRLMRFNKKHPSRAKPFDESNLNMNEEQELQLSSLRPLIPTVAVNQDTPRTKEFWQLNIHNGQTNTLQDGSARHLIVTAEQLSIF